jgi:hypothetical protein
MSDEQNRLRKKSQFWMLHLNESWFTPPLPTSINTIHFAIPANLVALPWLCGRPIGSLRFNHVAESQNRIASENVTIARCIRKNGAKSLKFRVDRLDFVD